MDRPPVIIHHEGPQAAATVDAATACESILSFYLYNLACGESRYADKLCALLAERPLYLLLSETAKRRRKSLSGDDLLTLNEQGRVLVPVWTGRSAVRKWTQARGAGTECLTMTGREITLLLDACVWLWLNPGDAGTAALEPALVARIAGRESTPEPDENPPQGKGRAPRILDDAEAVEATLHRAEALPSLTVSELIPISLLRGRGEN